MEGQGVNSGGNPAAGDILTEVRGQVGFITLNRPGALNALTLGMIRQLTACLLAWRLDDRVRGVAIRGSHRAGAFGAFCAGGDIRYFHQSLLRGDPSPEDFFTEEYTLDHLIHTYPKPYIAFMDGVVMGGGMGISQGASLRLVTARTKIAMPETTIGLFPDVGGGYFLSRCPGHAGEWLALTGDTIGGDHAVAWGLADVCVPSEALPALWADLQTQDSLEKLERWIATTLIAAIPRGTRPNLIPNSLPHLVLEACPPSSLRWKHPAQSQRAQWPPRCATAVPSCCTWCCSKCAVPAT
jgi:enoyl-CoA hydratase/carnithine racemase